MLDRRLEARSLAKISTTMKISFPTFASVPNLISSIAHPLKRGYIRPVTAIRIESILIVM
jgi:hypothetical protein